MAREAIAAFGTKLLRGNLYTPDTDLSQVDLSSMQEIAEVTNISGPQLTTDTEDATAHDSPDAVENIVATILRLGEVTVDVNFLPGSEGHRAIAEDWRTKAKRVWALVFPDANETPWVFAAIVTQAPSPDAPVAGILTASFTLRVTDDIWFGGDEENGE